jgi:hypothetical protein
MINYIRFKGKDGKIYIEVVGVDFGKIPYIIKETKKAILCLRPGYCGWCGIGQFKYYFSKFIIFEKLRKGLKNYFGQSFEYNKQNKKEIYKQALEYFKSIK